MRTRSPKSMQLYELLLKRGYPENFCRLISLNMNTDYTAGRLLGYLRYDKKCPPEQIVDEMLAIQSDCTRFRDKKMAENANAAWNVYLNQGFGIDEED